MFINNLINHLIKKKKKIKKIKLNLNLNFFFFQKIIFKYKF